MSQSPRVKCGYGGEEPGEGFRVYPSTEDIAGQDGRNGDGVGDGRGEDLELRRATARTLRCGGRARDDGERRKAQSIIFVGHFFFKFSNL